LGLVQAYRRLARNGPLTRLLLGEFASSIGDWLYLVALVVIVYDVSRDPVLLGIVGAARILPYALLSIPAGMVADRFDRRYVLLVSDVARGACMLVLAWLVATDGPLWAIVALAIVAACFSTLFYPAIGGLIPSLVSDETEFGPANSAWATLDSFAFIVGPAIGGVLVAVSGLTLAFLLNAASFAAVAVVLWTLPVSRTRRAPEPEAPAIGQEAPGTEAPQAPPLEPEASAPKQEAAAAKAEAPEPEVRPPEAPAPEPAPPAPGARAGWGVLRSRAVGGVVVVSATAAFAFGGVLILLVILATDVYHAGEAATGYLNAAIGVGAVAGALISGVLVLRSRLSPALIAGSLAFGVALVALGFAGSLAPALVAIAVLSTGSLIVDVARTTIFQRIVPDEFRGRTEGIIMTVGTIAEAAGSLVVPPLVGRAGAGVVLGAVGLVSVAALLLGTLLIGAAADVVPPPFEAALRRAARLPVFAGLSSATIEAALRRAQPVPVAAGTAVIRQGDPADRFYIIADGRAEVTQSAGAGAPPRVLRNLGRDDVFGELGLLDAAPRSATVTATTDGLLLALDGPDFREMVRAGPALASRLQNLYATPASPGEGEATAGLA